jgi:hypothetical protein
MLKFSSKHADNLEPKRIQIESEPENMQSSYMKTALLLRHFTPEK